MIPFRKIINKSILNQIIVRNVTTKDYDKKIKLNPIDIEYCYGDSQFLKGPSFADEPYIRPTDDEIIELQKLKMEKDICKEIKMECNPYKDYQFRQLYNDNDDYTMFTRTERINDEDGNIWKWVERLMPKQTLGPLNNDSELIKQPVLSKSKNLKYFISRTRSRLYPIYLDYVIVDRDHKHYWQNRWDHMFNKYNAHILDRLDDIKWENNEKTIELTKITQIKGDIWQFELDCRKFIENFYNNNNKIMSSVNEIKGIVQFKGNYIEAVVKFFEQNGF